MIRISSGSRCAAILALTGVSVGLSVFGCSAPDASPPGQAHENTGAIGLSLQASGVTLNSVAYTIIGPGGFSKAGTIDVTNSSQISTVIGGIPAGNGYSVSLTAADAGNSGITCAGSASFNVTAGATTSAVVHLICKVPPKTGSVMLNGTLNVCSEYRRTVRRSADGDHHRPRGGSRWRRGSDADHAPSALSYCSTATGGDPARRAPPNATPDLHHDRSGYGHPHRQRRRLRRYSKPGRDVFTRSRRRRGRWHLGRRRQWRLGGRSFGYRRHGRRNGWLGGCQWRHAIDQDQRDRVERRHPGRLGRAVQRRHGAHRHLGLRLPRQR